MSPKQPKPLTLEERRANLSSRLLEEARRLLDEIHEPYELVGFSAGKVLRTTLNEPQTGSKRDLMVAAAIAIDKHAVLERLGEKQDKGYGLVDQFIDHLLGPRPEPPTPVD